MGKIVTDNEMGMRSNLMKRLLREKSIDIHYVSSSNHNGNSDVERLHNTINEHLRILKTVNTSTLHYQVEVVTNMYAYNVYMYSGWFIVL